MYSRYSQSLLSMSSFSVNPEPENIENKRVSQMKQIHAEALALFTRKNADYGDAFAKYGIIGVLMRIEDKIQRAMSITKNGVNLVKDEGIQDTLLDLHNYAAMALMLLGEGGTQGSP